MSSVGIYRVYACVFLSLWSLGKCLSTSERNLWPIFSEWRVVPEDVVSLSVSPFGSCSCVIV